MKRGGITFDFWYGHNMKDVAGIEWSFYPNDGEYRGNMYAIDGRIIGDFSTPDDIAIEHIFDENKRGE